MKEVFTVAVRSGSSGDTVRVGTESCAKALGTQDAFGRATIALRAQTARGLGLINGLLLRSVVVAMVVTIGIILTVVLVTVAVTSSAVFMLFLIAVMVVAPVGTSVILAISAL